MPKITAKNIFVCCKQNEKVAINKRYHLLIKTKLHKEWYPASWFFPHALKNRVHRNLSAIFCPFWVAHKLVFSPFALSESLRSIFFLHLLFLSRSEAYFFSICSFWVAQKHIFSLFALSESLRSVFFLHLPFLSHSKACFFSFYSFWVTQKRVFSLFALSESLRSMFFLFFNASYVVCSIKNHSLP